MVLSEYWKRLEEIFRNKIISAISLKWLDLQKEISSSFFNILKEPLLVQKQKIPQKKALIFSFLQLESLKAWHYQEGTTPPCLKMHILLNFMAAQRVFWLLAFYEISRTPLLSYIHFQGVKLKLNLKAFFWGIVSFSTSIASFKILNSKIFRNRLEAR